MALWLDNSGPLRDRVFELGSPAARFRSYVDAAPFDQLLAEFKKHGAHRVHVMRSIFRMLSFEVWLELFSQK